MKGLSPTQRTLGALRQRGMHADIVERFMQYAGPHGMRRDLFNIIDILALDMEHGVLGIQSCGQDFADHWRKLTVEHAEDTERWLMCPGTRLELWGWRRVKMKRGGKAVRWAPRVQQVTLADLDAAEAELDAAS